MFFFVQMIDMVSAIEELSGLTTKELSEMLKESDNFVLQSKKEDGGPNQVRYKMFACICCKLAMPEFLTHVLRCRWTWKNLCPHFLFIFSLYVWSSGKDQT